MNQVSVRNIFVAASFLLLAFTPIRSAYAAEAGAAAEAASLALMQRLTWDGIALHAGEIPGRPASHGCVRLPLDFARRLFAVTEIGAAVHVVGQAASAGEALAMVRGEAAPAPPAAARADVQGGAN